MPKYALMKYPMKHKCNIGDYIQSLAAEQYLPRVDAYVSREHLSDYDGDPVHLILKGWFMHNVTKWPPSPKINPLVVSFHINTLAAKGILSNEGVEFFKRLDRPIGCRDAHTAELLQRKGIEAYFSGCLTTTLDLKYKNDKDRGEEILFVDPLFKNNHFKKLVYTKRSFAKGIISGEVFKLGERKRLLSSIFSRDILKNAVYLTHIFPQAKYSESERFDLARRYLMRYARAKLVVTSRIHCALPCLALGTPVIFLNSKLDNFESACRFDGIINLFNAINITDKHEIQANFNTDSKLIDIDTPLKNPEHYKVLAGKLKQVTSEFVNHIEQRRS